MSTQKLYRSQNDVIIGGVAAGLGQYFQLDPILFRIIFIVLTLAGGSGILLYLLLWLLLPSCADAEKAGISSDILEKNVHEMETKAKQAVDALQTKHGQQTKQKQTVQSNQIDQSNHSSIHRSYWLGFGLIIVGSLLLLENLNLISRGMFWPMMLILSGIAIVIRLN